MAQCAYSLQRILHSKQPAKGRRLISTGSATFGAKVPLPVNEPIKSFLKGSPERQGVEKKLSEFRKQKAEIPLIIGGKKIWTKERRDIRVPHDKNHVLGQYCLAGPAEVKMAIDSALQAKEQWKRLDIESRVSIMLRIAELLAGPRRYDILAATMLNQSKNFFQAEIDATCESIDFLRFNCHFAEQIAAMYQPASPTGIWNRLAMRPLEGFVYAVSPFNFTSIAMNLATAPALMGNTVVWKPSDSAILSGAELMRVYEEAGLPPGVINFVPGAPAMVTETVFAHPLFAGLHYTGSTQVFQQLWRSIGQNLPNYKTYPRIVGETGGKDFLIAHASAEVDSLVTALIRGAFEFAGQKCSALSRAYIPASLWPAVEAKLRTDIKRVKMGNPEDPSVLVNAVIHEESFKKAKKYLDIANRGAPVTQVICGGKADDSRGWFVEPTVVLTRDPNHVLLSEEIFGPILTVFVYPDAEFAQTLKLVDKTSHYALTGSVFGRDRYAIRDAVAALEDAAGNFYINDKPTGAVVGQQPFGGSRQSGTNDKAGSALNLLRWTQPRTIKETFNPPKDFSYPYMQE